VRQVCRLRLSERLHARPAAAVEHPRAGIGASARRGAGHFALEPALDELSYELRIDPLQLRLRLRNYAQQHPGSGLPWSSKAMRECFAVGAERFGWFGRDPAVGAMRDRGSSVGYGMAGAIYRRWQANCEARATIAGDGGAFVRGAANHIGTGRYRDAAALGRAARARPHRG
jgi:CO/xanthine dehydrogenase Mo-binding subunit